MPGHNQRFRQLVVESLESRELLSASSFDPSPEALELLERINRMRVDPQGELARIFSDIDNGIANDPRISSYFGTYAYPSLSRLRQEFAELSSVAPLAWDDTLALIANEHTTLMISRKTQSHQLSGELSLEQRLINSGFYNPASGKRLDYAENITAFGMSPLAGSYGSIASYMHEFLVIDFGNSSHIHRNNVMDPNFTLVGIGLQEIPPGTTGFGPWVVTVDLASFSNGEQLPSGGYLVGVAYDDANHNRMYDAGEGLGGMHIVVRQGDVIVVEFDTSSAGAYQQFLDNGEYSVTVSGSAFPVPLTQTVIIDGQNVKVDFRPQDAATAKPVVDLNGADPGIHIDVHFPETSQPSRIVSPDLTVSANGMIAYAVIQLQEQYDGNYEMLLVDVGGTSLASRYDSATGMLTISGTATAADYAKVLRTLRYQNTLDRPHLEARTVSVVVSNGYQDSNTAICVVKMDAVFIPQMTIEDVKVIEGDEGITDLVFVVELSEQPRELVVVNYEVVAGTAIAGVDFTPTSGRITFNLWEQTTATITVSIHADYDPGEDRTVLLNILSATNVNLVRDQYVGTILEDDNITHLGRMPSWSDSDLAFIDGRRLLYSFEAMYDGRVVWDTVLNSMPDGTRMVVYESSHSTIPIGYSVLAGGKQHLEFDVTEGTVYVVKIEGVIEAELLPMIVSTKMMQTVRVIEDGYEILGNPDDSNEFIVDFSTGDLRVGFGDSLTNLDSGLYHLLRFGELGWDDIVTIIGGGSRDHPIVVNPDSEFIVINGVTIDIGGLQQIRFAGSDGYDNVQIYADGDNCRFTFQDGNTTLVTATRVYQTFSVEQVCVIATGTGGVASFYDLPSDDTFTLGTDFVMFEGGGYRIETHAFQKADVYSVSGGNDKSMIYGENNSAILVADYLAERFDATTSYRVWNAKTVVAVNADETNNSVTFLNMSPSAEYYVALGCVSAFNAQRTVSYQAIGFNYVSICNLAGGTCSIAVSMEADCRIEMLDGRNVLTDGKRIVAMPFNANYILRPVFETASVLLVSPMSAVDLPHSQPEEQTEWDSNVETAVTPSFAASIDDRLLLSLAWEHLRKDNDATGNTFDDETDLLRFFARQVALMQLQ